MAVSAYDREIVRYLRDEYGIKGLTLRHTANHRCINGAYRGRDFSITLHDSKQRQQRGNLLEMKKQDIRRELGVPPAPLAPPRARPPLLAVEDLPDATDAPPSSVMDGVVAAAALGRGLTDKQSAPATAELSAEPAADLAADLPPIDRAYLKRLIDAVNRVVTETDYRLSRDAKTGRWRFFTVIE